MQTITNSAELKDAIHLLESEQSVKSQALKQQFRLIFESLRPINIIKGAVQDLTDSPGGITNVLGTGVGLLSGFFSKKYFVGTSGNLFRNLIGSALQFGITNLVSNRAGALNTLGQFVFRKIFRSKSRNSEVEE